MIAIWILAAYMLVGLAWFWWSTATLFKTAETAPEKLDDFDWLCIESAALRRRVAITGMFLWLPMLVMDWWRGGDGA